MAQHPVHFDAMQVLGFWDSKNRAYRVYVLPGELLFVELSTWSRSRGADFKRGKKRTKQLSERAEQLDEASLEEIRRLPAEDEDSFVATAEEIVDLRLDLPFRFLGITMSDVAGYLSFSRRDRSECQLRIYGIENMKTAYEELPKAFGEAIAMNVEWSRKKQRFIKKR